MTEIDIGYFGEQSPDGAEPIDHPGARVLYAASTGLEKAMADVDAERVIRLPDWLITDQWDPHRISAQNLPWLAYAMGVNLWESIWSEGTKRDWVARQWQFKALRGTPAAIRMALAASGYRLTDMVRPPQGFWAAPNLTKEQWDSWIRLMPRIKIYFAPRTGLRGLDEFYAEHDHAFPGSPVAGVGFCDQDAVGFSDGEVLRGRTAVLHTPQGDQPMYVIEYTPGREQLPGQDYVRVSTQGLATIAVISDDVMVEDDRFVDFCEADPKLITLSLDREYSHDRSVLALDTVEPGLVPLTPRYERESDIGDRGPWFFVDDFCDDVTSVDRIDGGDMLLADVTYLLDPAVAEPMTEGISFADISRVGMPTFTAEVQIDLGLFENMRSCISDVSFCDEPFAVPEDYSHIERACRAVCAAKALRDTILVSFAPKRPIEMGDRLNDPAYADWVADPL
jgi:phage tail P2-like protein